MQKTRQQQQHKTPGQNVPLFKKPLGQAQPSGFSLQLHKAVQKLKESDAESDSTDFNELPS